MSPPVCRPVSQSPRLAAYLGTAATATDTCPGSHTPKEAQNYRVGKRIAYTVTV